MVELFFDTNIVLHFKSLDEIDWRAYVGDDEVSLKLCRVVSSELDRHKNQSTGALRQRARDRVPRIWRHIESGPVFNFPRGVTLTPFLDTPPARLFTDGLDPSIADDELVASALFFRERAPAMRVVVVSDDGGVRHKARQRGLETFELKDADRHDLPDDAERELRRLKTRQPLLVPSFDRDVTRPSLSRVFKDHRKLTPDQARHAAMEAAAHNHHGGPSVDMRRLVAKRGEFEKEHLKYLRTRDLVLEHDARRVSPPICIRNDGPTPATSAVLTLAVPKGVLVYTTNMEVPVLPWEHGKPRRDIELTDIAFADVPIKNPRAPRTRIVDGATELKFLAVDVQPGHYGELELFWLAFTDWTEGDVEMSWTIHANELPDPAKGSVRFELSAQANGT